MKALRFARFRASLPPLWSAQCCPQYRLALSVRLQSTAAAQAEDAPFIDDDAAFQPDLPPKAIDLTLLPSPPPEAALQSAKLSALHARLSLPSRMPLQILAKCLVDASADPNPSFNNKSLCLLGESLFSYYTSEDLICRYPRLPMTVLFAAIYAFVGPKALAAITREWGVESAAEPGGEVDPGLLQAKRILPGEHEPFVDEAGIRPNAEKRWRRGISSRVTYDDPFGDPRARDSERDRTQPVTLEKASSNFARAVIGAVYLHGGRPAAKQFFQQHIMSRELSMAALFDFKQPTRDLSRLCAREGFEPPVARIISESGRKSRHPVFVVGVYSGHDELGQGAGSSLDEARTRAAVAALKGWYLYSPLKVTVPSDERQLGDKPWEPAYIDSGEVIV